MQSYQRKPGRKSRRGTSQSLFGWDELDISLIRLPAQALIYLLGNPGTARSALAWAFLLNGNSTQATAWISLRGRTPAPPLYLAQKHSVASSRGNLKVLQFDDPNLDDSNRLSRIAEFLYDSNASRAVIWQVDQFSNADDKQVYGELQSLLSACCNVSLAVGTLPSVGQVIEFKPATLCALADGILVTQLAVNDHSRASSLLVVKPVPAESDRPGSPMWYQLSQNGFFASGHKPSDLPGNGSEPYLHGPYFNTGKKQTYTFLPEISYHSREQEAFIRNRVEMLNSTSSDLQVVIPDKHSSSPIEYNQKIDQFKMGARGWDLFVCDRLPELVEKELVWPLGDFMDSEWLQQFLPLSLEQCSFGKRIWALPHWINAGVLLYRSDLLKRHKLLPPSTYDELIDRSGYIMKKEKQDLKGFVFPAARFEALSINFLEFVLNHESSLFDQPVHLALSGAPARDALTLMSDLIHKHHVTPSLVTEFSEWDLNRWFLSGECVFIRAWPQLMNIQAANQRLTAEHMDIAPLPTLTNAGTSQSVIGGLSYVIPRHVEDPRPLLNFLKRFFAPDAIADLAIRGWTSPPYKSAYSDPLVLKHRPYYQRLPEMMTHGRARKELPCYDALSASIQKEVHETLRGIKEPAEALGQIVGSIQERTHQQARRLRLRQILEYIDNHLHEELERDSMAAFCNLTPGYFSTLFTETIGEPFVIYVNRKRIEKAKELLSSTELSIGEISARTGFKSSAYFCSVFRKEMSMSPTSYRMDALSKYIHR